MCGRRHHEPRAAEGRPQSSHNEYRLRRHTDHPFRRPHRSPMHSWMPADATAARHARHWPLWQHGARYPAAACPCSAGRYHRWAQKAQVWRGRRVSRPIERGCRRTSCTTRSCLAARSSQQQCRKLVHVSATRLRGRACRIMTGLHTARLGPLAFSCKFSSQLHSEIITACERSEGVDSSSAT